jgi:hypothetical protein
MVAPVITFSDVMTANKATWELKAANLKRTGWRLGYSWKNSDKSYLSYKAEVGSRPGFLEPNYFLNLILGWTIPFNL